MSEKKVDVKLTLKDELTHTLHAAEKSFDNFKEKTVGRVNELGEKLLNVRNIIAGFAAVEAVKLLIEPAIENERVKTSLRMISSNLKESKELAELHDTLKMKTLFDDQQLLGAMRLLRNLAGETAVTEKSMLRLADAAQATGVSIEKVAGYVGRLKAGLDSGEVNSKALTALQRFGMVSSDTAEALKGVTKGLITTGQAWEMVSSDLDRFSGASAAALSTAQGAVQRLTKEWEEVRAAVGEEVLPALVRGMDQLSKRIDQLRASGELKKWGEEAGAALEKVADATIKLIDYVSTHGAEIKTLAELYAIMRVGTAAGEAMIAARGFMAAGAAGAGGAGAAIAGAGGAGAAAAGIGLSAIIPVTVTATLSYLAGLSLGKYLMPNLNDLDYERWNRGAAGGADFGRAEDPQHLGEQVQNRAAWKAAMEDAQKQQAEHDKAVAEDEKKARNEKLAAQQRRYAAEVEGNRQFLKDERDGAEKTLHNDEASWEKRLANLQRINDAWREMENDLLEGLGKQVEAAAKALEGAQASAREQAKVADQQLQAARELRAGALKTPAQVAAEARQQKLAERRQHQEQAHLETLAMRAVGVQRHHGETVAEAIQRGMDHPGPGAQHGGAAGRALNAWLAQQHAAGAFNQAQAQGHVANAWQKKDNEAQQELQDERERMKKAEAHLRQEMDDVKRQREAVIDKDRARVDEYSQQLSSLPDKADLTNDLLERIAHNTDEGMD